MKFLFRSDGILGLASNQAIHTAGPTYFFVLEPHNSLSSSSVDRTASMNPANAVMMEKVYSFGQRRPSSKLQRRKEENLNPAVEEEDLGFRVSKWKPRRSAPLDECDIVCAPPACVNHASRPKSRQFFPLGRNRHQPSAVPGATKNEEATKSLSPPPVSRRRCSTLDGKSSRGIVGLRKPTMKRTTSLPSKLESHVSVPMSDETFIEVDSADTTPVATSPTHRRSVTFSSVQVREYCRILGDHPCCHSGPPLSLGWELEREDTFHFETFEQEREPSRRSKDKLRLCCDDRREILGSLVVTTSVIESPPSEGKLDEIVSSPEATACCRYSREEIRKIERRLMRERSDNHRFHRKINNGFFKPIVTPDQSIPVDLVTNVAFPQPDMHASPVLSDSPASDVTCDLSPISIVV